MLFVSLIMDETNSVAGESSSLNGAQGVRCVMFMAKYREKVETLNVIKCTQK